MADRAWFYAWCGQCSTARQCIERRCTADGRLPPVADFICEGCQAENERAAEKARRELRELELLVARLNREEEMRVKREEAQRRMRELQAIAVRIGKSGYIVRPCPNPSCGVMVHKVCLILLILKLWLQLTGSRRSLGVTTSRASVARTGVIFVGSLVTVVLRFTLT